MRPREDGAEDSETREVTLDLMAWEPAVSDLGGDRARRLGQEREKKRTVAKARTQVEGGVIYCFLKYVRDTHI